MTDARGFSNLYPTVPIMNVISMALCLLLITGFWKTRMVAPITLAVWIFLANLMDFIGMIQWRGNTNDVPIWADFVAALQRISCVGWLASMVCFAHFTWQRLLPLSMRQLYDTRRRNNRIHFVVSVIVPLLWGPLFLVSCPHRYIIVEDVGPVTLARSDWPGFVLLWVPQLLSYLAGSIFNALALVTYRRMKREDIESDLLKDYSSVRTRKLLLLALSNILLAAYGISRPVRSWVKAEMVAPRSFSENIASLQSVLRETRSVVEEEDDEKLSNEVIAKFAIPLLGFYLFAWFGCGEEARKAYREALMKPVRLIGLAVEKHQPHAGSSLSPWSCITLRGLKLPWANSLPNARPNAPQITPYTSAVPQDNSSPPSATPANDNPSSPVGNIIGIKRQGRAPSREPARRLSMHKPPVVHLEPPNVPDIAGLDASGSVASHVEGMDCARRQEKLAPRARPRRLSYHKPAFVPLVPPAKNTSGVATASGSNLALVEVPRDLISERNARLQAERALNSGMIPPPFSSPSTSTAPPPFSAPFASMSPPQAFLSPSTSTVSPPSDVSTPMTTTSLLSPSTMTPAPPYQHLNPFPDHLA